MAIKNANIYFKKLFVNPNSAKLFLNDGVLLNQVYVEPKIEGRYETIEGLFAEWLKCEYKSKQYNTIDNTSVLMLCGKAGIGKTSFVAKFISKDCTDDKYMGRNVYAVKLKDNIECFDSNSPWLSIYNAFGLDGTEELEKILFILDGFDELCVLKGSEFKGEDFLENLSSDLPVDKDGMPLNIKILITSREYKGYFKEVEEEEGKILIRKIQWTENEMNTWCDRYSSARNNSEINDWCDKFKYLHSKLEEKQKDIFCTPIILYICCHEKIDISDNKSISDIYDKAFKSIVTRQYGDKEFAQDSRVSRELGAKILWQFTKEIAYQMFLNSDEEESALVLNKDGIEKAKKIVKDIYSNLNLSDEEFNDLLEKLPAIFHFTNGDNNAVEFAHKTVFEYFTAVKLYEDYFVKYSDGYLNGKIIDEKTIELWNSITEAFRYKKIPKDIFEYMNGMNSPKYDGKDSKEEKESNAEKGFDYTYFEKLYVSCIKNDMWFKNSVSSPKEEYFSERTALPAQLGLVFRNLTYFLTGHGYTNSNSDKDKTAQYYYENMRELICCSSDLKLSGWNLGGKIIIGENRVLTNDEIRNIGLSRWIFFSKSYIIELLIDNNIISGKDDKVVLIYTNLSSADLSSADLSSADLSSADLRFAKLISAKLISADLSDADLRSADLTDVKYNEATKWENARYNSKTIFPENFDPKARGMILVEF